MGLPQGLVVAAAHVTPPARLALRLPRLKAGGILHFRLRALLA